MFTCSKKYSDLPFAHRQHNHAGHCRFIHGHNWGFKFTFGAKRLDVNMFVIDFGDLKWLKLWLHQMFDHTLLLNAADPMLEYIKNALDRDAVAKMCPLADLRIVPNCGAEGLALFVFEEVDRQLRAQTQDRVFLVSVEVYEDEKNAATYSPNACRHD